MRFSNLVREFNMKEIKPRNITSNDKNYRKFLKLLQNLRPSKAEFLTSGLTEPEIEKVVSPFYKSMLNEVRLTGYNIWVRSNKLRIYEDIKRMKKDSSIVIAPDNAVKAETFDNFVQAIRELKKDGFENVMENYEEITKRLFDDKKRLSYVRRYMKQNLNDLRKKISEAETESDIEEDNVSVNSMDTNSSRLSQKIFEGFAQSTPKKNQISSDNMEIDSTSVDASKATESKMESDSGFNTADPTSSGIMADVSAGARSAQDDGENERSARDKADLSTNSEKESKTGPSLKVSSDEIVKDYNSDDTHERSISIRLSKKTPKRSIASVEEKNQSGSNDSASSRSKRLKLSIRKFADVSPRSAQENSHKHLDSSSANIRGRSDSSHSASSSSKLSSASSKFAVSPRTAKNATTKSTNVSSSKRESSGDSKRSESFTTALSRIDTNSSAYSGSKSDEEVFVTANESYRKKSRKENSGRDSGSIPSENSE